MGVRLAHPEFGMVWYGAMTWGFFDAVPRSHLRDPASAPLGAFTLPSRLHRYYLVVCAFERTRGFWPKFPPIFSRKLVLTCSVAG